MDGEERGSKLLQAALRGAAERARLLAEALDSFAETVGSMNGDTFGSTGPHTAIQPPEPDQLWNTKRVAQYLGVSEKWVRHAVAGGRLPSIKIGGVRRFLPDQIRACARGELPWLTYAARVIPRRPRRAD